MTDSNIKYKHRVSTETIITLVCMLAILAALGSSDLSAEKQEGKSKKPRFELSETALIDNRTRLMWPLNGNLAEATVSWDGASEYIYNMNRVVYGGYKDWRMPSREELESLVVHVKEQGFGNDAVRTAAAGLHALGMKNIKEDQYWTSTEHIYNSGEAWFVNMRDGSAGTGMKTLYFQVLPVRSLL